MSDPKTTRFAPSPTGYLHLGHAYSALVAERAAQASGGRFLLRIEDIDLSRCKPEFEAAIYEDLQWLGLRWEQPVRRQSDHFPDYTAALERLRARGVIYPCFCTRQEIAAEVAASGAAPHGPDGPLYPGTCRTLAPEVAAQRISAGATYALRLDVARGLSLTSGMRLTFIEDGQGPAGEHGEIEAQPMQLGDVVLARKETPTSYHLSVVHDDALQGITLITRGQDLFHATHIHRLLQALLDLPTPRYAHHALLTDESGRRFAKRDRSLTLRQMREDGVTPDQLHERLKM